MHALLADGLSIQAITRRLHLSRGTVRRYARARTPDELIGPNPTGQRGRLAPFKPYLQIRNDEGVTDSKLLYDEMAIP